jgi:hypothetical protein
LSVTAVAEHVVLANRDGILGKKDEGGWSFKA